MSDDDELMNRDEEKLLMAKFDWRPLAKRAGSWTMNSSTSASMAAATSVLLLRTNSSSGTARLETRNSSTSASTASSTGAA
ncbi:MAG: hypothetical protein R3B91_09150 [Planctomycetaceae bacterium]